MTLVVPAKFSSYFQAFAKNQCFVVASPAHMKTGCLLLAVRLSLFIITVLDSTMHAALYFVFPLFSILALWTLCLLIKMAFISAQSTNKGSASLFVT